MGIKKKDSIPAELVARHVRDWVDRYNGDKYHGFRVLSMRSGMDESYFAGLYNGTFRYQVGFDSADRMFCAMEIPNIWYCDTELEAVYPEAVSAADSLYPVLAVAA